MADEYISRDETKAEFKKNFAHGENENFANWLERVANEIVDRVPNADVQPVDRWISVKDRLPDNCVEVLAYDTDCGIVIGWYDKEIGDFAADFISLLDAVTHWQPLPEPPKDGDTNLLI